MKSITKFIYDNNWSNTFVTVDNYEVLKNNSNIFKGQNIIVPGDISSAAFWMIAAAIVPESEIVVKNVGLNPTRTGILEIMKRMEVKFKIINQRDVTGEPVGVMKKLKPSNKHAGPELYLELRRNGKPVNPLAWLSPKRIAT